MPDPFSLLLIKYFRHSNSLITYKLILLDVVLQSSGGSKTRCGRHCTSNVLAEREEGIVVDEKVKLSFHNLSCCLVWHVDRPSITYIEGLEKLYHCTSIDLSY